MASLLGYLIILRYISCLFRDKLLAYVDIGHIGRWYIMVLLGGVEYLSTNIGNHHLLHR